MAAQNVPSEEKVGPKEWGFDYLLNTFLARVEELDSSKRKAYAVIALAVSALLLVASIILGGHLPSFVQALLSVPTAITIFLIGKSLMTLRRTDDKPTSKEKRSPAQRMKIGGALAAAVLVVIFLAGGFLPYSLGGALLVTAVLFLYDYIRRTPEEIALQQAGIIDPRDLTEDEILALEEEAALAEEAAVLTEEDDDFFNDEFFTERGEEK